MNLFIKGIQLLSTLFKINSEKNIELEDKYKKKLSQLILSNIAIFHTHKPLENIAFNILKNISYENSDLKEVLISAVTSINSKNEKISENSLTSKYVFPDNDEIRSRFLTFISLYAENILNFKNNEILSELIEIYFNKIVSSIYYTNDPSDIGFVKNEGFPLAIVKLQNFLLKNNSKKLQISEDKKIPILTNINDKILRMGLSYIKPETRFINKFINDFDNIYETLHIKYNPEKGTFIMETENNMQKDLNMKDYMNDFYDYKNTIYLQSFFFYDFLNNLLENFEEKLPEDFLDTLNLIVNHVISCCDLKTEKNYLGSSVKKNSNYLMTFILNKKLNDDKNTNVKIKNLLDSFWKMLYYVIKNDEINVICGNEELITALITKLNEEISQNPNKEIQRQIYSLISSKLDNNIDTFNKIFSFIKPEILLLDQTQESNDKNIIYDLEILSSLSKYNIATRTILKNPDLLDKLKSLFYRVTPTNEKIKLLLSNIFSNLLKNKINHELIINNHSDLIKNLIETLKDDKIKDIFEINSGYNTNYSNFTLTTDNDLDGVLNTIVTEVNEPINNFANKKLSLCNLIDTNFLENFSENIKKGSIQRKILQNQIGSFVKICKENQRLLAELNILNKSDLIKIQNNFISDEKIQQDLEKIIKNLSETDKENELSENLKNFKLEIREIQKFVNEAYTEHCNQIKFSDKINEENSTENPINNSNNNIIGKSMRLSVGNIFEKISGSSKKLSIFSKVLLFSNQLSSINSPLSSRDNEEIQSTIEKILNFLSQLYYENKNDLNPQRKIDRKDLMSTLLHSLKSLSISSHNHVQILELGLINLMEKINTDKEKYSEDLEIKKDFIPQFLEIETLNVMKNCTTSDNAIPIFISSAIAEKIINEIFDIYKTPEKMKNDTFLRDKFSGSNKIFSNLCQNKKGFLYVLEKLGLMKLLELAKNTYDELILDSILEMIINYINNQTKEEVDLIFNEIFAIVLKCYKVYSLNREKIDLLTKVILIIGLISSEKNLPIINEFDFVKETCKFDMNFLFTNQEFLNTFSFTLGKLSYNNPKTTRSIFETGIIYKINDHIIPNISDLKKINFSFFENISGLYRNLLVNNFTIISKFTEKNPGTKQNIKLTHDKDICSFILFILEKMDESKNDNGNITIFNLCETLDKITMDDSAIQELSNTNYSNILMNLLGNKQNEGEIIIFILNNFNNFFQKEIGNNLISLNFEKILQILRGLQKKYYLNSDILMLINSICSRLFYNLNKDKDKPIKENLFNIIVESLNIQDWNVPLILTTLRLILEILKNKDYKYLVDLIYDDFINTFLGVIRNHQNNSEILNISYKILSLFGQNNIYGYSMINEGLLDLIQESFTKINTKTSEKISNSENELKETLFNLLARLCNDKNSVKKISDSLTENLVLELTQENPSSPSGSVKHILKLFKNITSYPNTVESFLQQNGLVNILKFLKEDPLNIENDLNALHILSNISNNGDNYKKILREAKTIDVISTNIDKTKHISKEIGLLGSTIIHDLNDSVAMNLLQAVDIVRNEVKKNNSSIKAEIKNFLINGKIVNVINTAGVKKQMLMIMTQDLLRIICKKINSNDSPKAKYIIETSQVKRIIRGYANPSFTKSVGFFSKLFGNPLIPQLCFSIYANTRESEKILNIKCETEEEANSWIENLKTVLEYLIKNKTIKSGVQFSSAYK